jgi:hypothetical protein
MGAHQPEERQLQPLSMESSIQMRAAGLEGSRDAPMCSQ